MRMKTNVLKENEKEKRKKTKEKEIQIEDEFKKWIKILD